MYIFYTIGNKNMSTIKLVAKAVYEKVNLVSPVDKIVIFNTPASHSVFQEQVDIYRSYLGQARIEEVMVDENGIKEPKDFSSVFEYKGEKIIDLTNGQKTTTALLYLTASLIGIDNIYYLSLKVSPKDLPEESILGKHYEYVKVPKIDNISELAKVSYFDLIYYLEEVNLVLNTSKNSSFMQRTKHDLHNSIIGFFKGNSNRSLISDATTFVEVIVKNIIDFLKKYQPAIKFSQKHNISFEQRDPIGAISFFFNTYSKENGSDNNLKPLITLPGLLSALRNYRNIAAHSGSIAYDFKSDEVRIVINMALEALRRTKMSDDFWRKLERVA